MTLATLQAQHPEWCFTCGQHRKNSSCLYAMCSASPVIAALKEELAKAEATASGVSPRMPHYPKFNEDALGAEIERVWGSHGAHAEVYRMLREEQRKKETK